MFLALDSSGEHMRIVVSRNDDVLLDLSYQSESSRARRLFSSLTEVLTEEGISLSYLSWCACGLGPGNFISTRYAVSLAHGLSTAMDVSLAGFNSLLARGLAVHEPGEATLVLTRAKKRQFHAMALTGGERPDPQYISEGDTGSVEEGFLLDRERAGEVAGRLRENAELTIVLDDRQASGGPLGRRPGVEVVVQETIPTAGLLRAAQRAKREGKLEQNMKEPLEPIYLRPAVDRMQRS